MGPRYKGLISVADIPRAKIIPYIDNRIEINLEDLLLHFRNYEECLGFCRWLDGPGWDSFRAWCSTPEGISVLGPAEKRGLTSENAPSV